MNLLIISGNLTKDCRVASTPAGKTVCNFDVAVNVGYDDNKRTEFYQCALWGKRAEGKLPEYLVKGQKVMVTGDPQQDKSESNGKTYFAVKVFVNNVELLGSNGEGRPQERQQAPAASTPPERDFDDFEDRDIPF